MGGFPEICSTKDIATQIPKTVDPSLNNTFPFQNCPNKTPDLKYLNFTVLKAWCIVLSPNIQVSTDKFASSVLHDHSINNVTICIFNVERKWIYPSNTTSMAIYKVPKFNHNRMVSYSPGTMKSVEAFVRTFVGSKRYVAVMVRTQQALMEKSKLGLTRNALESISICTQRTIAKWKELSQKEGINATFLAIDVGDFGSYHRSKQFLEKKKRECMLQSIPSLQHSWEMTQSSKSGSSYLWM